MNRLEEPPAANTNAKTNGASKPAPVSRLKGKDPKHAEPSKPKILIFGKPGVGKTWTALDFPSCYYIDTEGGADLGHYTDKIKQAGGVYMGPEDGSNDFQTVIEQFQALATEKHGYKTVIVDSISKLFNTAIANEAERLGEKNVFGADKKPAIAFMRRLVAWVNRLDMNVLFIAHSRAEWGTDAKGDRAEIGQTFDAWEKLGYELHLCLEILKQGASRKAKVVKSRLTGFPDASLFDWSYATFAERYGKDVIEAASTPIQLASSDQVSEIERLVRVVKVDQSDIDKALAKAGAENFGELNTEQADKLIVWLKKKVS
jgi:hypothetical protein